MQMDWASRYTGVGGSLDDQASAVCVDDSGNVYVTGSVQFTTSIYFCTTIKYNRLGTQIWVRNYQRPGSNFNIGFDILLDNTANVLIAGAGSVIKYDGNGNLLWTAYNDADYNKLVIDSNGFIYAAGVGSGKYVVGKYDRNGHVYWINRINGAYRLHDLELDKDGNILIAGEGEFNNTFYDYTTIKYNSNTGYVIWKRQYSGPGPLPLADDVPYALTTDSEANVYVTGASMDASGIYNCVTVKYDSTGNEIWVKRIYPPSNGYDIKVDNLQNVYIASRSSGYNYTMKLDINANILWTRTYPTTNVFAVNESVLILDSAYNIYVTANVDSNNFTRYGAIKYDNNGNQLFLVNYYYSNIRINYVYDMKIDKNGNLYLTGASQGIGTYYDYATVKYSPIMTFISENNQTPLKYNLSQNYPNPFNPTTNLEFGISELGFVSLKVYDISGKEVTTLVNEQKAPGYYSVSFNGANLSSGIYFYSIKAGDFVSIKKMTLIK